MTQEQKEKLEETAEKIVLELYYGKPSEGSHELIEFNEYKSIAIACAQTILENPKGWDLMPILDSMEHIEESDQNWSEVVDDLKSQLTKYREALEHVLQLLQARRPHTPGLGAPINIIKSVIEQEGAK